MEVGASMAMQSRAHGVGVVGAGGRRSAFLVREKQARAGILRVGGGTAGATAVAVRARGGTRPVAPLCCVRASRGNESLHNSVDEALLLKRKSEEVLFHLNGRCIYLVGMMGSGKSTVGKILAEVLGYSCFDSDKLVEQAVGMPSVAEIFKVHSEAFFRENESSVLRDLSSMRRLVVATGGGAVIRPINWNYMKKGLSVWLDVPLDALAKRISQVGTASRPLLDQPSDDPYTAAFTKLSMLLEQRGDAYANADARVSLEEIAAKQGHGDVSKLTPTDIAIEVALSVCLIFFSAIRSMLACKREAEFLEKYFDSAREKLPETMASLRLIGREVGDLAADLSDLSQELTKGVKSSMSIVHTADAQLRQSTTPTLPGTAGRMSNQKKLAEESLLASTVRDLRGLIADIRSGFGVAAGIAGLFMWASNFGSKRRKNRS